MQASNAEANNDSNTLSPGDLVSTYFAVWNEPDAARRAQLLVRVWADDGVLIQPLAGRVMGRDAVLAFIGACIERWPGAQVTRITPIDAHHGVVRYGWRIVRPDGSLLIEGVDVDEFDASGRLKQLIEFDGLQPPAR